MDVAVGLDRQRRGHPDRRPAAATRPSSSCCRRAGDLVNPQANKCVDIKDWNADDGARLQLWDCAGTANQKWRRA